MAAVSGLLAIKDASTNEWVGEFQQTIFVRNSRGYNVGTTLFGLMARLDNEPADTTEFNWFERDPATKTIYTNAGLVLVGSVTLTMDDGAGNAVNHLLEKGQILMNDRTREFVQISGAVTPTGTDITVTRGFGGAAAAALADNDTWTIITLGKNEGEAPIRAMYETAATKTNYIQTFNSTVELTNAFKNSVLRTDIEGPLTDRRIQALERISRDIEFAYFLGIKKKTVVGNGWELYSGGIFDSLIQAGLRNSNILYGQGPAIVPVGQGIIDPAAVAGGTSDPSSGAAPAGVKLSEFNGWLSNILPYGSDAKLAFCGPAAYQALSSFANTGTNGYRIMQNETVFGINIQVINTPFGELSLTQHPLMREALGLRDWMFIVDLAHVTQKTYEKLFLEPNIQTPGVDSYKEQYRAKLGLKLKFANAFGVAHNLSLIIP